MYRKILKIKRSKPKEENKKEERDKLIIEAHRVYCDLVESFVEKAKGTLSFLLETNSIEAVNTYDIIHYMGHAERKLDQIRRRVIGGETIPHEGKVFSIF